MDLQLISWLLMLAFAVLHLGKVLRTGHGRGYI